jgi:hypothetical protein
MVSGNLRILVLAGMRCEKMQLKKGNIGLRQKGWSSEMTDKVPEALTVLDEMEAFIEDIYPNYDSVEKIRKARAVFAAQHEALKRFVDYNAENEGDISMFDNSELWVLAETAIAAVEKLP